MKKVSHLLVFLILTIFLASCVKKEVPGPNYGPNDIIWEGSVMVLDTFFVEHGTALRILPGTKVSFGPNGMVEAEGDVYIEGAEDSRILLEVLDPIGDHRIVKINGLAQKFYMNYTDVINGLFTSFTTENIVNNCTFSNDKPLEWNDACMRFWLGKVEIEDCTFNWNNQGEGLLHHGVKAPKIRNCTFVKIPDAVEYIESIAGEITNNRFVGMSDDAVDQNACTNTLIQDNIFIDVKDRALELGSENFGSSFDLAVKNNLFINCKIAVNLKESSHATVENCTFYGNELAIQVENPADSMNITMLEVDKCVVAMSTNELAVQPNCQFNLSNSITETQLDGTNVIMSEVVFEDVDNENFTILSSDFPQGYDASNIGYRRN